MNPRGEHKPMHKAMARAQVLKSFTFKSHQKQLMLMGGEERKNKEENHTRTPRSRSTRFPSLRGEIDWWKCRSRSPLSNPSKICQNHGRKWERGKLCKVNNGGGEREKRAGQSLGSLGKKGLFIGLPEKEPLQEKLHRRLRPK